jgi:hypothetical protein
MNWEKYFKQKDCFKRYEMLEKENRLSYDHVDNWLLSLREFLEKSIRGFHIGKDNHKIGCELESYTNVLRYRGFEKEADIIDEVASRLK